MKHSKHVSVVLVVLLVALAGCSGGGGTATTDDGDDADPAASPTASGVADTPTPDDGTDDSGTDDSAIDDGSSTVDDGTDATGFNQQAHATAVSNAGSYTVVFNVTSVMTTGGRTTTTNLDITQQHDVDTGEAYTVWDSNGRQAFEYYNPPNSDVAYANVGGQVQEVSADQSLYLDYLALNGSQSGPGVTTGFEDATSTSGSTALGPATKYTIDSADQLSESPYSQYDAINSLEYSLWVDDDTGILAKYETHLDVVQGGEPFTVTSTFEVTDLGSTTIQKPSWAP